MSSNIRLNKVCQHCQQEFIAKTMLTRYCSHACNRKAYKQAKREEKLKSAIHDVSVQPTILSTAISWHTLEDKLLLNLKEAAQLLNISPLTLRRWLKDGIITSSRLGKKHLFDRVEIKMKLAASS
ncbi:excisionase family DNA binding protein [Chitinophaga polysaccharea]|uniref:Excisionase family DNA binding protein n=1 Tax=Chitinophaga polysaccharea TaxID=1293035 RepID=A0A561P6E6_9BACT|nr:helix-turn-helix domain-containing protein [Chitinophaga polysaccharea]TWF33686.1 excisionase family DNA binding protein [Chitinophaga polysaccharea]